MLQSEVGLACASHNKQIQMSGLIADASAAVDPSSCRRFWAKRRQ